MKRFIALLLALILVLGLCACGKETKKEAKNQYPLDKYDLNAYMLPNPEADKFLKCQKDYLPVLESLEEEGVVVADMTTYHESLLAHKRFYDMSGNNVNHPNDFLARAYAQLMWQTVIGY